MRKYCVTGTLLAFMVCLAGTHAAAAISPERLQMLNLNLYAKPCPANELTLRDMRGTTFNLASLRGKVILLNFWRIDCPPCAVEKPILERLFREYADRGLAIVAVNLFDDANAVRDYKRRGGYTFTFACDPWNRLSVRRQDLGSGVPTCFVVNASSEAVYEIKAVPTTYVIDRQGKVVGHSTGMVNWQQPPLQEYLESLLGAPVQTAAQRSRNARAPSTHVSAPLASRKPHSPPPRLMARSPEPPASSEGQPTVLPFQGVTVPKAPVAEPRQAPSVQAPAPPRSQTKPRQRAVPKPPPEHAPTVARSKPPTAGPSRKPAVSRTQPRAGTGPSPHMSSRRPARPPRDLRAPTRSVPAPMASPSPSGGTQAMPYLPPAIPYTGESLPRYTPSPPIDRSPARARSSRPRINLDQDVSTMAQVPSSSAPSSGYTRPRFAPPPQTGPGLPSAVPMEGSNPIRGFVLDSFGPTRPRPIPLVTRGSSEAPRQGDSSLFGQLGRLGNGVRDALSRIVPGQ